MLPVIVALPLAVRYCVAIGRRMMRLTSIFQSENYSIRPYYYRLVHLRDEGYYTIGNLISAGLLVGLWAASFNARDPYGYGAYAFLLIGLAANWLIVLLSLVLLLLLPPVPESQLIAPLTPYTKRLLVATVILTALLSLVGLPTLFPITPSELLKVIFWYWLLFGAALMLLIGPFILPLASFANHALEMLFESTLMRRKHSD